MINISNLIEHGGSVRLEVRPDDLEAFAESVAQKMEVAWQKKLEADKEAEEEQYITTKEALAMLGICNTTIIKWAKEGYLVPVWHGGKKRFALSDVKRVMHGRKSESVSAFVKRSSMNKCAASTV